ncbi:MarR family winged helix-turn-helix transcriptional regulator [Salinarimonas ramus]|uniref:MarR family transcriptional regulator n=1 Tax=Salinarimonas ramus TaxID=690164 RepID=A0A917QEL4_9HYPH|nr:MarR family transcriptional regulator [Salinarimonas ramus]GGK46165.1 MarR family transcriptional regulator [Salinarimonas ramus]
MSEDTPTGESDTATLFRFLNEVAIVAQLSGNAFEKVMPGTMTLPQFIVLNHLVRLGDGRTPLRIANALQVSKGAMTNTLGHLERAGWIAVRPDDVDRRSKRVDLTGAGREAHAAAIDALGPELAWLAGAVPPARVRAALPLMEEMRRALDVRRG